MNPARTIPLVFCLSVALALFPSAKAAAAWGRVRTVSVPVAILSERGLEGRKTGTIEPGQWFKVDFTGSSWSAVFPKDAQERVEAKALGYVYAPLLKPYSAFMENVWNPGGGAQPDAYASLSDEFCKLSHNFDDSALETLLPQLSRAGDLHTDDLPKMIERRIIRVLTTYSMSTYFISEGKGHGFEYSLLRDFEDYINEANDTGHLRTVLEFIPVPESLLITSLNNGIGDIVAAGVSVTPEREALADFTHPYLTGIKEVLVTHLERPQIGDVADLAGRQVYVLPGTDMSRTLRRLNSHLLVRGLKPLEVVPVSGYLTREDVLELVNAGYIDMSIVESHVAELWAEYLPNIVLNNFEDIGNSSSIAWMVRKDNPLLKESLNAFLDRHQKGTFNWNLYYNRYFLSSRWIQNPLHPALQEVFSDYAPLFRKYAARYGFDWMLLAAIAFQESGLNHRRVSNAGAVGLMQVLPTTADDVDMEAASLKDLEANVHAAARYLSLLRDVYFSDPEIPPEARMRFVLAAYNAGPSAIQRCRRIAAKLDLDPNRWFYNTELVALKTIGTEPVRYVSNIKKYYMAYSLSQTMDCLRDQMIEEFKTAVDASRSGESAAAPGNGPAPLLSP